MSVKLEALDQQVVEYLHKLWNSQDKKSVPQDGTNQSNQISPPNSLIQSLIDINAINGPMQTEQTTEQTNDFVSDIVSEEVQQQDYTDMPPLLNSDGTVYVEPVEQVATINTNSDSDDMPPLVSVESVASNNNDITDQVEHSEQNQELDDPDNPDNSDNLDSEVDSFELDITDKPKFKKQVKENLRKIREIGFRVYQNVGLEKEVNLVTKSVTDDDINKVYNFKVASGLTKKGLMNDISRCTIFPKYKSGDVTKPENFRYLVNHHNTVKILDRIWCMEVITKCGQNLPDKNIYRATLVKSFNGAIINTAIENTNSTDSVVLLDIEKAFDSLDWDVLEALLTSNLTRKINKETATDLVSQYMTIIKNRELYYNNNLIQISKGISTGLPSSNLVFTLALEEVIFRWFKKTSFANNKEFKMVVYVDDIYLNIIDKTKSNHIVNSLIDYLASYKLNVNKSKSKACDKLNIDIPNKLKPTDYYLGIPFTRDIKLYGQLILKEYQLNKANLSWSEIYNKLASEETHHEEKSKIAGFMDYKLRPFLDFSDETKSRRDVIKQFIFDNYVVSEINETNKIKKMFYYATVAILLVAVFAVTFQTLKH